MDAANVLHVAQRIAQTKAVIGESLSARRADVVARASSRAELQRSLRDAADDETRTALLRAFEDSEREVLFARQTPHE